jgi:hypothetical protein
MYGDEILEAVDARELSVCTDDLCETAADVREDLAVDTRPGILLDEQVVLRVSGFEILYFLGTSYHVRPRKQASTCKWKFLS